MDEQLKRFSNEEQDFKELPIPIQLDLNSLECFIVTITPAA
jgi:hypothetical protein